VLTPRTVGSAYGGSAYGGSTYGESARGSDESSRGASFYEGPDAVVIYERVALSPTHTDTARVGAEFGLTLNPEPA